MAHVATETFVTQEIIGPYVVDEIPPPLQITFKDCNSTIIDLSGYTPKFEIIRLDGADPGNLGLGNSTIIAPPTDGITQYQWADTDFQTAGMYRGVMWAANGTLRYASIFFEWFVRDSLTTPGV